MQNLKRKIQFPKDAVAHKCVIEWWYFNGALTDKNGGKYSFMNCLFKADPKRVHVPLLSRIPFSNIFFHHEIISDLKTGKSYREIEFPVIVSKDSFSEEKLFVNYIDTNIFSGYVNYSIEEIEKFSYRVRGRNFDLSMVAQKPPLYEGGTGLVDLKTKKTYCYSLTNLLTEGRIRINGRWIEVKGKSWMDHQWSSTTYSKDRWAWFSIQLNNGTEIVCFEYEDRGRITRQASVIDKNGRQTDYFNPTIEPAGREWKSRKTKTIYPLVWRLFVPEGKIDLLIEARTQEQEMIFGPIKYWEGPTAVAGGCGGHRVTGVGFMELVGFHDRDEKSVYSIFERAEKSLRSLSKKLKNSF